MLVNSYPCVMTVILSERVEMVSHVKETDNVQAIATFDYKALYETVLFLYHIIIIVKITKFSILIPSFRN